LPDRLVGRCWAQLLDAKRHRNLDPHKSSTTHADRRCTNAEHLPGNEAARKAIALITGDYLDAVRNTL
jgi:hypothetical protein